MRRSDCFCVVAVVLCIVAVASGAEPGECTMQSLRSRQCMHTEQRLASLGDVRGCCCSADSIALPITSRPLSLVSYVVLACSKCAGVSALTRAARSFAPTCCLQLFCPRVPLRSRRRCCPHDPACVNLLLVCMLLQPRHKLLVKVLTRPMLL